MNRALSTTLAVLALASTALADIKDGDKYKTGSGSTVTVTVNLKPTVNVVDVYFTDSAGNTSNTVQGTPGAAGGNTCSACPEMQTSTANPTEFRVKDGKAQYKNAKGEWVDASKAKNGAARAGHQYLQAGQMAPYSGILAPDEGSSTLPLMAGELAPVSGWLTKATWTQLKWQS